MTINFKKECPTAVFAEVVKAFATISQLAMSRIDVDFKSIDLYMAFGVFHLSDGSLLLAHLPRSAAVDTSVAAVRMRMHFQHLWNRVGDLPKTMDAREGPGGESRQNTTTSHYYIPLDAC